MGQAFKSSNKKNNFEPRSIFTPSSRLTNRAVGFELTIEEQRWCMQDGCFAEHQTRPKSKETQSCWLSSLFHRWNSLLGKWQSALLGVFPNENDVQ
jgi:hypothetical protein